MLSGSRTELPIFTEHPVPTGLETKTGARAGHPAPFLSAGPEKQLAKLEYCSDALAWP